jgi:hypothetical protein
MTLSAQRMTFTSSVDFVRCRSSDPTVRSGRAETAGPLTGSCLYATGTAVQTVRWSNGRTSVISAVFVNSGPELVRERVTSGEFATASGGNINVVTGPPSVLLDCAHGGLSTTTFAGQLVLH